MSGASLEVHLTALGVPIRIHVDGVRAQTLYDDVERAWAWCRTTPSADGRPLRIRLDEERLPLGQADLSGVDLDLLMDQLSWLVTRTAIQAQAGSLVMLHACALADPQTGDAVVLVGPSEAGKTTASQVLGRRLGYLSDETVGVRDDGTIVAYPKPLSVRHDGGRSQLCASELGLAPAPDLCRVAQVLLIERAPGHRGPPDIQTVETLDALSRIAPESSFLGLLDRPLHRLASAVQPSGRAVHSVRYREAEDLIAPLADLLT